MCQPPVWAKPVAQDKSIVGWKMKFAELYVNTIMFILKNHMMYVFAKAKRK